MWMVRVVAWAVPLIPWWVGLILGVGAQSTLATAIPAAQDFGEMPLPQGAAVAAIGEAMRINGQPARLYELQLPNATPEELLAFYRQRFGKAASEAPGLPPGRRALTGLLKSPAGHETLVTVMILPSAGAGVEADGGVRAHLLQTRLTMPRGLPAQEAATVLRQHLPPMPPESQPLSQVESDDHGQSSRLTVYTNRHSAQSNIQFVEQQLTAKGWRRSHRGEAARAGRSVGTSALATSPAHVIWFSGPQDAQAMLVVAHTGGRSVVTLNTVTSLPRFTPGASGVTP